MSDNILKCEVRDPKSSVRSEQALGVVFGLDFLSTPVSFKLADFYRIVTKKGKVFDIELEGKEYVVNVKEVQKNFARNAIHHVSFHKLDKSKKTVVHVPIRIVGDSQGKREGGVLLTVHDKLPVEALPSNIPEFIEVDVSKIGINESVTASDVTLPANVSMALHEAEIPEEYILTICKPPAKMEEPEVKEETDVEQSTEDTEDVAVVEQAKIA